MAGRVAADRAGWPKRAALLCAAKESPAATPREISSRSSNGNANGERQRGRGGCRRKALTLAAREEISCGVAVGQSLRSIARGLGQAASLLPGTRTYAEATPMTNLWLTLLERMGVHPEMIGESTGRLEHLTSS